MLNQRLQQKLLQKLSPQQILLMKLLQIPSMALEQRIKQEIEENPALEEVGSIEDDSSEPVERDDDMKEEEYDSKDDEFDLNDYMDDDEIPSYKLAAGNQSADDEHREIPYAAGMSFQDMLLGQLIDQPHGVLPDDRSSQDGRDSALLSDSPATCAILSIASDSIV